MKETWQVRRNAAHQLDEWRAEKELTLEQLHETVLSLVRRSEFQRGYKHAQDDQRRELAKQAAIERNGGTEPEYHNCHFCGEYVANGYNADNERHWLSDCRPDLVEHEPGETCTWWYRTLPEFEDSDDHGQPSCYAFQDRDTGAWGDEHKHFYQDGPT